MNLLGGIPKRRPAEFLVYSMPRDYYDPNDPKEHLQLVVGLDPVRKEAITASRTTKAHARGPHGVPHPVDVELGLMEFGWWRIDYPHRVPYAVFDDEAVEVVGLVDETTQRTVKAALAGPLGAGSAGRTGERGES